MTYSEHQRKPHLFGRDHELGALQLALAAALDGHGSLVTISGEAGIGKTALIGRLAAEALQRGAIVRLGHCFDLEVTPSFGPWQEILRGLHSTEEVQSPDCLIDSAATSAMSTPDELRVRVGRFLSHVAADRPLVIVLEDVHWADQSSIELARYLSRQAPEQALLIVLTYRDAELGPENPLYRFLPHLVREGRPVRIALRPLGRAAVRDLVADRYGLSEADLERLVEHLSTNAEGNPFFIEELLNAFEDERILRQHADGWSLAQFTTFPVPILVRQFIDGRLERVAPQTLRALQAASVLGSDVALDLWQSVAGLSDDEMAVVIGEAVAAHVLIEVGEAGSFRFRHALIRRSLYDGLPLPERRIWHRKLGDALARRSHPDLEGVAYHLWQANDDRAPGWLVRAGDQARARSAPSTAIELYTRAFQMAAKLAQEVPVAALHARGRAYATVGDFDSARTDYQAALGRAREVGDQRLEWQTLIDLGVLWTERDYTQVIGFFNEALALAEALGDPLLNARTLAWIGTWHLNVGDAVQAAACHHQALDIHERLSDQNGIAATHAMLAMDNLIRGDLVEAHLSARRAERLFRAQRDQRGLASTLIPLFSSGGASVFATEVPAEAESIDFRAAGIEAVQIASAVAWRAEEAFARGAYATYLSVRGEYAEALVYLRKALAIARDIEHREWIALSEVGLGEIYLDLLDFSPAVRHLARAREVAARVGSFIHSGLAAGPLARALIAAGDPDRAESVLAPVLGDLSAARTSVERACWRAQAELELARGNGRAALRIVDELIATTPNGSPNRYSPYLALLQGRALVSMNRLEEADRALDLARRGAGRYGFRPLLWRCCDVHADVLQRLNRPDDSRRARASKQDVVDMIAITLPDDTLRERFLGHVGAKPEAARATRPAGLSERELEVLRLAARGLTNAQIGEQLFISPRTVKGHLESIYGKLGVETRTAAAAFAFEHELT